MTIETAPGFKIDESEARSSEENVGGRFSSSSSDSIVSSQLRYAGKL